MNLLNSEKKGGFLIPDIEGVKDRKNSQNRNLLSVNSNRFELASNKGPGKSIMSTRSRGPSVNDILARRK